MLKDRKIGGHSDVYGGFPAVLEKTKMLEELESENEPNSSTKIQHERSPSLKLEPQGITSRLK
jgi:hypothetical protein